MKQRPGGPKRLFPKWDPWYGRKEQVQLTFGLLLVGIFQLVSWPFRMVWRLLNSPSD
jgi:hypothetical protein